MAKNTKFNRNLKPFQKILEQINNRRSEMEKLNNKQLKERSEKLKQCARKKISLDDLLMEAFALVCEASHRTLKLKPFDVQILAGITMHQGNVAEMQTGEGKTLAAVMPAYLNALEGKGVHILTFNDYLARRDANWMGPIYEFLGLTVRYVQEGMTIEQRKNAYNADITYLTAKESGFDFLRDQRCYDKKNLTHRSFNFAIVDEADSILIDEARIPLVMAGEMQTSSINPYQIANLIRKLEKNIHFQTDEYGYDVNFTDEGIHWLESSLQCKNLHQSENNQILAALNLALQAEILIKKDDDYIIRQGKIELVDQFTGRIAENRRWPYGLQTAIEAKENLEIQPEGIILGSITLQHYLNLYPKIAGMTATAKTAEDEFKNFYGLKVVEIPPNRPCQRIDHPDIIFTHKKAKYQALIHEIAEVQATGRPILVGTANVNESERLAKELHHRGIKCQVLNAKNDELEAKIISEAGTQNAVTISTNMAGRGTDIKLGGKNKENYNKLMALGGLYVIGTNRHESSRIDRQLRGRAGRQGEPGSSRFFISIQDDLIQRYRVDQLIPKKHLPSTQLEPLNNPVINREISRAQRIIEGQNFEIRKTLRKYSYIIEAQRKILQTKRGNILLDQEPLTLLKKSSSKQYKKLLQSISEKILQKVEKRLTLFHIDQCWAEHLEYLAQIKEGIHLWGIAGKDPVIEFGKIAIKAFDDLQQQLYQRIISSFEQANITKYGINLKNQGLLSPSSTWTYMVNDSFFENPFRRAVIGRSILAMGTGVFTFPFLPVILLVRKILHLFSKKKHTTST